MLPRVKIFFENGNLGLVAPSPDGLLGIACTGAAVSTTFALATPYFLTSLSGLTPLGVTEANNASLYKIVKEFYQQAGEGTEVYLMAFPDTVKHSDMVDITNANGAKKLVDATNGKLRGLIVSRTPAVGYVGTTNNGIDADITLARANAQVFAEHYTNTKYAPLFVIIEAYGYNGNTVDLKDLTTENYNRVSIMLGDTVVSSKQAAVGILAGRLAIIPVQRNIGRVKDGALTPIAAFVGATPTELADVGAIHDKGYITFRTFVNQSGYYFNDDFTATLPTDDYSHLTARRTIDKAFRIAYNNILQNLLDEVPVNEDGTLPATMVKAWQADVENAIVQGMTVNGELSADVTTGDNGVTCYINTAQNLVATSQLKIQLRVRPFGYPRYIDVYLGFQITGA
jgi:hypothetical protein